MHTENFGKNSSAKLSINGGLTDIGLFYSHGTVAGTQVISGYIFDIEYQGRFPDSPWLSEWGVLASL